MKSDVILISIDHETMGTNPYNSIILSTGIVIGDTGGNIYSQREYIYPLLKQIRSGYKICPHTVKWWTKTKEKQNIYKDYILKCSQQTSSMQEIVVSIYDLLFDTLNVIRDIESLSYLGLDSPNVYLCANSPKFDIAFLDRLFKTYLGNDKKNTIYSFRQEFDFRTVNKLCKNMPAYLNNAHHMHNAHNAHNVHNALADAFHQYKQLVYQLSILDITL